MGEKKAALITGAGRGIGKTVAIGLARDGYNVGLISRNEAELNSVSNTIRKECSTTSLIFPVDLTNRGALGDAVATVVREFGRIDVLFNNAGIWVRGSVDVSFEDFDRVVAVNLIGAHNILKMVVPHMESRGSGYIFNVCSVRAKEGAAGAGAYCASKFGLLGLSESLYFELAPKGVKVTALCPSWVNTEMVALSGVPKSEMIRTGDILSAVRFLLTLPREVCVRELVLDAIVDF